MKFIAKLLASAAFAASALWAQPITIGEIVKLPSKVLQEERTLHVSLPPDYAGGTGRYPVLYLGDGNYNLGHTRGTVDFLVRNGLMPDVIIVGIVNTDRDRDFLPTRGKSLNERTGVLTDMPTSGGSGRFLDFFHQELFPFVEGKYRTQPYRIFAGHSSGGLLALYAFISRPELFHAAIAVSPSLGWDDSYILKQAEAFFPGRKALDRRLYVAMANEEEGMPKPTRFERLRGILSRAKAEGFTWESKSMPQEDHGSLLLEVHLWALRRMFDGWRLPVDPTTRRFMGGVAEIKEHYARFGRRLGCTLQPPMGTVNNLGRGAIRRGDHKLALELLSYNVELHPANANAHNSLGEAHEAAGRLKEALASFEKAVELGKRDQHPLMDTFLRDRDRLAKRLAESRPEDGQKVP